MVENKVQQEILYREALAMGLDKNDEIVKRRMAQKMQFLAEDVAAAREPTTDELKSWFEKNSAKFALPPRLSFRHLYFSPDRRGTRARDDAAKALAKLAGQPEDAKLAGVARRPVHVPGLLPRPRAGLSRQGVRTAVRAGRREAPARLVAGADRVRLRLAPGVRGHRDSRPRPGFEEIEPDVKTAWLGEQKALAWEKAYKEMRAKYTVLLPAPPERAPRGVGASPRRTELPLPVRRGRRSDRRAPLRRMRSPACLLACSSCSAVGARRTRRVRPIWRSRKPRPASSACSGARRCWRACACPSC